MVGNTATNVGMLHQSRYMSSAMLNGLKIKRICRHPQGRQASKSPTVRFVAWPANLSAGLN